MDINRTELYKDTGFVSSGEPAYGYTAQTQPQTEPKKEKNKHPFVKTAALVLCCSMLSGTAGAAIASGMNGNGTAAGTTTLTESSRAPQTVNVAYVDGKEEMTAAEVYAANVNSTVGITTSTTTNYWGYKTSAAAAGSGFIVSENGYIVTNYHVVEDSTSITVSTYDGKSYDATLVGYDESNDLAVLKIDASGLTPVVMGDSDTLNVGDDVVAIGNPLGELTFSLTKGSVSALNREVTLSSDVTMNLIQTDAAINSGNSGGALFNMYGEVVGITNAKYSGSGSSSEASVDNIGFAIPLDSVKTIITSIIEKGYVSKPYIGVQLSDANDAALVYRVTDGSPAAKAGLQANDIITEANGEKIASANDLTALVKKLSVGDELKLTVSRGGQETTITVTVGEQQQSANQQTEANAGSGNGYGDRQGSGYDVYGDYGDSYGDFGGLEDFFGGLPFGSSGEYYRG